LPAYYSRLAPFEPLFATGAPILTYHKLGPRPRHARLKGLYVSQRLFARQMAELAEAGFTTPSLTDLFAAGGPSARAIGLTFDDGFRNVLTFGLEPLARHRFRAIQFLVAGLLGRTNEWDRPIGERMEPLMDASEVREWLAAGHAIGSHTLKHPRLTELSAAAAREEIIASKKRLEDTFGIAIEHFCYPYGDWNEAVRDLVAEAGYRTACTTEFGVNAADANRLALRRITARYPSRNLKTWLARFGIGASR